MTSPTPPLEPLRTQQRLRCLSGEQLDSMQEATLRILDEVGVRFPSEKTLAILADLRSQCPGAAIRW